MTQNPNGPLRHELVTWEEVDKLVDTLVPQIKSVSGFDGIIMITRGGIIPGGLLAEALNLRYVLTAAVRFPKQYLGNDPEEQRSARMALPSFLQFPERQLLEGRQLLVVDDVWGSGRTSTSVTGRVKASGARVYTCVFHFNPYRSMFADVTPDFYGATTDAYIIYPWETDRGTQGMQQGEPQSF